jgi:branched-chain amino acid transport system substrate-binding protein
MRGDRTLEEATMSSSMVRTAVAALLVSIIFDAFAADNIKIAFNGGLSGPYALQDEEFLKGFEAAADMINARGGVLGGRKIEIVPLDNKANPQEALIVLKRAIDQDIRYIIAGRSNIALTITDAVLKHNSRDPDRAVLFLDYNGLDPSLTESKCNFWHFRFAPHTDMAMNVLTDYMAKQRSIQKVYLINQDYAYGQAVARAAKEMLAAKRPEIQIVGNDFVPLEKVKDFSPYVAKIVASGADSVVTGNWGSDLSLLIRASNEAGSRVVYYTTPAAIGAAGADRVKTLGTWQINAADAAFEKALLDYKTKYKAITHLDYLPPFRVLEMVASAMNKAGTTDPTKVARTLEGMKYIGPSGESWMRAEDHQIIAPIYIMNFVKAGQLGVKHDEEGTGYGWKTEAFIAAKDTIPPMRCQMERPPG